METLTLQTGQTITGAIVLEDGDMIVIDDAVLEMGDAHFGAYDSIQYNGRLHPGVLVRVIPTTGTAVFVTGEYVACNDDNVCLRNAMVHYPCLVLDRSLIADTE